MKKHLLYAFLLFVPAIAVAEETDFSYNTFGTKPEGWGTSKAETIDVAVRLYWPGLAGKQIKSMSVQLSGDTDDAITDVSGFITSELKTRNQGGSKFNDPDICSVAGTLSGNTLRVDFPEPYTIPAEGVFVGYSLTVTDADKAPKPISTVKGCGAADSFWYRTSQSQQRWYNQGKDSGLSSALTLTLSGDFDNNSAFPCFSGQLFCAADKSSVVEVSVISAGLEPLQSVDYTWQANGVKHSATHSFRTAIPSFGSGAVIPIDILPLGNTALTSLDISIDKVNGKPNPAADYINSTPLEVLPFLPHNRPLVEEYTGLRCGYCPMGWVILKQMAEDYGRNEFVALSFHSGWYENGCMVYLNTDQFPYKPDGYPAAQVNRAGKTSVKDIAKEWQTQRMLLPEGEISVSLSKDELNPDLLRATSFSRFIHDCDEQRYKVAFALVADGLSNPEWLQYNAYTNQTENTSGFESEYWDLFLGRPQNISNLTYDDIVIHMPDATGIENSLPDVIDAGRVYENEFMVDTSTLVNVAGERTVSDFSKSRVVAMIIDAKTGRVVNAASSNYADGSQILSTTGIKDSPIVEIRYYDLCGRRLTSPPTGICIKSVLRADGSILTQKLLNR